MPDDASTSRLQSVGFGSLSPGSSPSASPVNLVAAPYSALVTPRGLDLLGTQPVDLGNASMPSLPSGISAPTRIDLSNPANDPLGVVNPPPATITSGLSTTAMFPGLSAAENMATLSAVSPPSPSPAVIDGTVDSRVRIALPPKAGNYYKLKQGTAPQLLAILQTTDGVLFPFQPAVDITYKANYESMAPVHSNFAFWAYKNSSIDAITLSGSFFVRTPSEGHYVIAAIQFLRAVTMMFTGQDGRASSPWQVAPGTPPQVVRLFGMGFAGLDNMPAVVTSVTTRFPEEVDYVTVLIPGTTAAIGSQGLESVKIPVQIDILVVLQPIFSRAFASRFSAIDFSTGQQRLLGPHK